MYLSPCLLFLSQMEIVSNATHNSEGENKRKIVITLISCSVSCKNGRKVNRSPKRGGTRQGADRNVVRLKATLATSGRRELADQGQSGLGTGNQFGNESLNVKHEEQQSGRKHV